jgi:aminoglycoside phosphotransferase family enzyme
VRIECGVRRSGSGASTAKPADQALDARIATGELTRPDIERIVALLTAFYRREAKVAIAPETYIAQYRAQHLLTAQVLRDPALTLVPDQVDRALEAFEAVFDAARPTLILRAAEGHLVEGHGDLRPEHVFLTDPPVVIDCLEFSRPLRIVDPHDEIAFLGMECARFGADWIFAVLAQSLAEALDDRPPAEVMAFYWRYRALLRARLLILHLRETPVRTPARWRPLALRYLDLADGAEIRTRPPEGR